MQSKPEGAEVHRTRQI